MVKEVIVIATSILFFTTLATALIVIRLPLSSFHLPTLGTFVGEPLVGHRITGLDFIELPYEPTIIG